MERLFLARQVALAVGLCLTLCPGATGQDKKESAPSHQSSDLEGRLARVTGAGKQTEKMRDPVGYKKLEEEVERAIRRGGAWLKKLSMFDPPALNFRDDYPTIG